MNPPCKVISCLSCCGAMKWAVMEPYRVGYTIIEDVCLIESMRHDFTLSAVIDGKPCKHPFRRNTTVTKRIVGDGGSKMPTAKLQQLIQKYLMDKRR